MNFDNFDAQVSQSEFAKHLKEHGSLNGYWTYFLTYYPEMKEKPEVSELDRFLLEKAPVSLATQERFRTFRKLLQKEVREGVSMASVPSGIMGDFLLLDFSGIKDFELVGLDNDPDSIEKGQEFAKEKGLDAHCTFEVGDAWALPYEERFDVMTSNGLNIYVEEKEKVVDLYRQFHKTLKPGGLLVTSFMTFPPGFGGTPEWKLDQIDIGDAMKQREVMDLFNVKFRHFTTSEETQAQLEAAGFKEIAFHYDTAHIYPTITGRK